MAEGDALFQIQILPQLLNIGRPHITEDHIFSRDIANLHNTGIVPDGNGCIFGTVEIIADDARAEGISIQPLHEVEHCGAIRRVYHMRKLLCAENLLCQIERALVALLEGQARIIGKLLKADGILFCQRVFLPDVGVNAAVDELMKLQMILQAYCSGLRGSFFL